MGNCATIAPTLVQSQADTTVNSGKPISLILCTLAGLVPGWYSLVHAADTATAAPVDNMSQLLDLPLDKLTDIVVTGTAEPRGMLKQDASYAITTVSSQAMHDMQASNAADLTRLVPGMWAETTGGVAGPNVDVRGFPTTSDTPWVSVQVDGMPIYPSPSISWLDNFSPFRLDDTTQRMEATLSGPAVLWGMGQPGATVNFIQKNGLDNPGGILRVTTGTNNLQRFDGYVGGQLIDDWYASIGGFYREDDGQRNTQYPGNRGNQLVATLTHPIEDGRLTWYGRYTNDQNVFYTAIPLSTNAAGTISTFAGFDPLTATLYGNNTRYVSLDTAPGQSTELDMAKGRGINLHSLGFDADKTIGDIRFSDKMSYTHGEALTVRQESGPLPQTLADFIGTEVSQANSNSAALAAAGGVLATGGVATFAGTGQTVTNLNQQVIAMNVGAIDKQFAAFQNEARLTIPVGTAHRLTFGIYYASYSDVESDEKGAYQLMQLQNNPQVINLMLDNGVRATNGSGIFSPVTGANHISMSAANLAGIVADEWQITERIRADAGYRFENNHTSGWAQDTATGNIGSSPLDLFDDGAVYRVAGTTSYHYDGAAHAFSGGVDYKFNDDLSSFARFNQGYQFPNFDNIFSHQDPITHVQQMQAGVKQVSDLMSLHLTAFYGKFTGKPQQETLTDGSVVTYLLSANTAGIELESVVRPSQNWQLSLLGDYMHSQLTAGGPGITGNMVEQQPALQMRITPSYSIPTSFAQFRLFAVGSHVGHRYSDPQNLQPLPAYNTLDIGAVATFNNGFGIQFTGSNVTNTLAITEGNARVVGTGVGADDVMLGRPLFGASYQLSIFKSF